MNPDTLRQLISNCRKSDKRVLGFPRDWSPGRVNNPESPGFTFTENGAWLFLADKLESGHPYELIELDSPRGALAVVLQILLTSKEPLLYVKIQIGPGKAIGRSFHYSDRY